MYIRNATENRGTKFLIYEIVEQVISLFCEETEEGEEKQAH